VTGWQSCGVEERHSDRLHPGRWRSAARALGPDALDNPPGDLFWSKAYLWNNEGDEAVLYGKGDRVVDRVCYLDGCL
jgi:hypothetical protein